MTNIVEEKDFDMAYDQIKKELANYSKEFLGWRTYVEIFDRNNYGGSNGIELGVNWSAIGTVTVDNAEAFIKVLTKATELAKNFKYNGYKIHYSEEE